MTMTQTTNGRTLAGPGIDGAGVSRRRGGGSEPRRPPTTRVPVLFGALLLLAVLAAGGQEQAPSESRDRARVGAPQIGSAPAGPGAGWAAKVDWSGHAGLESRAFASSPQFAGQEDGANGSFVLEPELYRKWERGGIGSTSSFTFTPFVRYDSQDRERTHWDIRELHWRRSQRGWDLLVGVSKVFWGVTESQHLVDIVNQTDQVENPDGEDKLGQPMVKLSLIRSWGIVDLFLLTGFRERTFPGPDGRLRPEIPIADGALYESSAGDSHLDWAARWSHAVGPFDIGVSHFSGTTREPRFLPRAMVGAGEPGPEEPPSVALVPLYELIDQTGVDAQATVGSWLWKLEAIRRTGQGDPFAAATLGLEYTFWGVFGSKIDLGAVAEYLWDERGAGGPSPFQRDLFVGSRLALNDTQDSQVLAGVIADLESDAATGGKVFLVEASRRIGSDWVVELEMRTFSGVAPRDPLASLRTDDYFQLSVQRHF
jgi:hypothetical protein